MKKEILSEFNQFVLVWRRKIFFSISDLYFFVLLRRCFSPYDRSQVSRGNGFTVSLVKTKTTISVFIQREKITCCCQRQHLGLFAMYIQKSLRRISMRNVWFKKRNSDAVRSTFSSLSWFEEVFNCFMFTLVKENLDDAMRFFLWH